jgi:hypothetical protein
VAAAVLVDENGSPLDISPPKEMYENQLAYFRGYLDPPIEERAILLSGESDGERRGEAEKFVAVRSVVLDSFGNAKIRGELLTVSAAPPVSCAESESPDFVFTETEEIWTDTYVETASKTEVTMYLRKKESAFIPLDVIFTPVPAPSPVEIGGIRVP